MALWEYLEIITYQGKQVRHVAARAMHQTLQGPAGCPGARTVGIVGLPTVTLELGQELVSDPMALRVEALRD